MGQYKVPQNVEAEDKILGPLTFRQFLYALGGAGYAVICFALLKSFPIVLILVGLPPTLLLLLLAFYTRDGQNFEQILIALVQFFAASRKRLWIKEDTVETFHVEPTKLAIEATQRNPHEVRSELEKVAVLIDSRGWNQPPQPETTTIMPTTAGEERIVTPPPPATPTEEPGTDMLDLKNSPLAQNLADLIQGAAQDVREEAVEHMTHLNQPQPPAPPAPITPAAPTPSTSVVTAAPAGDILKLATQSDDLTVSQIAAQATRTATTQEGQAVDVPNNGS